MLAPTCFLQHALRLCNVESIDLVFKGPWVFNVGKKQGVGGGWGGAGSLAPTPPGTRVLHLGTTCPWHCFTLLQHPHCSCVLHCLFALHFCITQPMFVPHTICHPWLPLPCTSGRPIANQLVWHHVPHRRHIGLAMQFAFVAHCHAT